MQANSLSRISFSWAHRSGLRQKHAAQASSNPNSDSLWRSRLPRQPQFSRDPSHGIAGPISPVQKLKPFGAPRLSFKGPDNFVRAFKSTSKSQQKQRSEER